MEGKSPYVTARAVTTRTATTHHDLDTKAKTQQMEEKTVAHTLTSSATRQEQRVLTQEVKTTVTTGDKVRFLFIIIRKISLEVIPWHGLIYFPEFLFF